MTLPAGIFHEVSSGIFSILNPAIKRGQMLVPSAGSCLGHGTVIDSHTHTTWDHGAGPDLLPPGDIIPPF